MSKNFELEFYKLEVERLKSQLGNNNNVSEKDIIQLVQLASEMRELLQECRSQQINVQLARKIDNVLSRARDLD